ncbi:hypothetical protein [Radiobacillus sp. PE A8.2]|uniref:hypothetical protein n=1 Tax=Radiobacillus sp. PE A8.2 TaxID=3380349 RepID=UPI00388D81D9
MRSFNSQPKAVKKTIRYILQDTDHDNLTELEQLLSSTIRKRKAMLENERENPRKQKEQREIYE